ncbi:MAG TPA: GNAT family N-acetyltransferase [Pyrinomonadaceae bacterium]
MTIELRRASSCSFETLVNVWNEGFQGYFVDISLSLDKLLARLSTDGISFDHSFIAFDDERAVGFLLNALREEPNSKLAWNSGTAVVPDYRGQGIGSKLMQATIDLYRSEGVKTASLEAVKINQAAISLYKRFGYEVVDELTFLQAKQIRSNEYLESPSYIVENVELAAVGQLKFYRELSPWQGQWRSLVRSYGSAIVVRDNKTGGPIAYALFRKRVDEEGRLVSIVLYQCEVAPDREDAREIAAHALHKVFMTGSGECGYTTHNFRKSNKVVVDLLLAAGFNTFVEQVHMISRIP